MDFSIQPLSPRLQEKLMARISITADIVALSTGSIVLAGLAGPLLSSDQAGGDLLLNGHYQPLLLGMLGVVMVLLPLVRRVVRQICDPLDIVEFDEMARSLRRVGLGNRVQTVNLYLAEQDDAACRMIFRDRQDLWDWLGEAYRDETLRLQMLPQAALRVVEAGRPPKDL